MGYITDQDYHTFFTSLSTNSSPVMIWMSDLYKIGQNFTAVEYKYLYIYAYVQNMLKKLIILIPLYFLI